MLYFHLWKYKYMLKQSLTTLFCSLLIVSCSYFENKYEKEQVQVVDTIVDFNTVDAFPLFPECKDIPSREKQKICFQLEISQHIYGSLKQYQLNSKEAINDTVLVKLKVNAIGETSLTDIQISKKTKELLPEFDSIVKVSLLKLPTLLPAIKRDMPVSTEFVLPIVLKN